MIDLTQTPYVEYVALLELLRESDEARELVAFVRRVEPGRGTHDVQEQERARLAHVMLVQGAASDLELVRYLLDQEIAARQQDSFQGASDALSILSMLLLEYGPADPEDVWRFWLAKRANFDTFAGGYDISFVFAEASPESVRRIVEERGDARELELLDRYDAAAIVADLERWRGSLSKRFPRSLDSLDHDACAAWAQLFGDTDGLEYHGLQGAQTPEDRAYVYRRLERYNASTHEWLSAAAVASSAWDRASLLQRAVSDAAKGGVNAASAVEELDVLRREIPEWNDVGLGRMATQACHELAAALDDAAAGRQVWETAEHWRKELRDYPLAGIEAAITAASKWGEPADVAALRADAQAEKARIEELLR